MSQWWTHLSAGIFFTNRFTASVGPLVSRVVCQARIWGSQRRIGPGQPVELDHVAGRTVLVEVAEAVARLAKRVSAVHLPQQQLGHVGAAHLTLWIGQLEQSHDP